MNLDVNKLDKALIICPNDYKEKLLQIFNDEKVIVDANFTTLEEYKKNYLFNYGIEAINYLRTQGLSVNNAKEILENICYVENKEYGNEKLDKLVEYKNQLDNKGLLEYNNQYKEYLKQKNIIVAGYGELNKFDFNLLSGKSVTVITDSLIDKKYQIHTFNDIEEEVEYVYNKISDLLEKGIDINSIYILNANSDYDSYIKRFNTYYGFKVLNKNGNNIYGTNFTQTFIEMLDTNTKDEIYDYLITLDNSEGKTLLNILNKYSEYEISDVKELIINDTKKAKNIIEYRNVVKCVDLFTEFNSNEYVFLIGFNESIPTVEKDIKYITDDIRHLVGLTTTEENNKLLKNNLIKYLSNIDNLTFTYSKNSPFNVYNKQILISNDVCEYVEEDLNNEYSDKLNKAKYSDKLDKLRKFNSLQKDIDILYKKYGKNEYLEYNNRFKGLNDNQIDNLTTQINSFNKRKTDNDKLTLSYSTMNSFYECGFKYYLESVLGVKEVFGNYYTKLGTVCHGVLKDLYNLESFDFEESWNKQIKLEEEKENTKIFEDKSEEYFVDKIKEELRKDIEIVKTQKENSLLDKQKCENYFNYEVTERINFIGFIDKLMYKELDNEIITSVVDYKTSKNIEIDKDIMKFGLSLQLPSYLYLIKHSKNFTKEVKIAGLYIQHLINYERKYIDNNTDLDTLKNDSMKLDGISTSDSERIKFIDSTLFDSSKSQSIKGISINKDGSIKKSGKLYSDNEFNELEQIVENSIKKAGKSILEADFSINPKQIDGKNVSCGCCPYAAICYKRATDLICISSKEDI